MLILVAQSSSIPYNLLILPYFLFINYKTSHIFLFKNTSINNKEGYNIVL